MTLKCNNIVLSSRIRVCEKFQLDTIMGSGRKFVSIAQQELRSKREQEVASLKKAIEEETANHESHLQDMRHKHTTELTAINEQLENFKKTRMSLEKQKQTFEAENADLATELRNINQQRQENDRRRKQAEQQFSEVQVSSNF